MPNPMTMAVRISACTSGSAKPSMAAPFSAMGEPPLRKFAHDEDGQVGGVGEQQQPDDYFEHAPLEKQEQPASGQHANGYGKGNLHYFSPSTETPVSTDSVCSDSEAAIDSVSPSTLPSSPLMEED